MWPYELHHLQCVHPFVTGTGSADKWLKEESTLNWGCGGIGILWKRLYISPISDRIDAINIKAASAPILVVGVDLPTWDNPTEDFQLCVHMIDGLVNKHHDPVILAGDFNCHVEKDGRPRANVMSAVSDTPCLLYLSKMNCDNVSGSSKSLPTLLPLSRFHLAPRQG